MIKIHSLLIPLLLFSLVFSLSPLKAEEPEPLTEAQGWQKESNEWQKIEEIAVRKNISREKLEPILNLIDQARAEGFPEEPFLNKTLEGIAKVISPSRILQVLQGKQQHFQTCQEILNDLPEVDKESSFQKKKSLAILAESMERGVSEQELKDLGSLAKQPPSVTLANAAEDLATLKGFDIPSKEAVEIVQIGLRSGGYQQRRADTVLFLRQAKQEGVPMEDLKQLLITQRKGASLRGQGQGTQGLKTPRSQQNPSSSTGADRGTNQSRGAGPQGTRPQGAGPHRPWH